MAKGLLRIRGTIDLHQFWFEGESDADTVNVLVDKDAFEFSPTGKAPFRVTHVLENAFVQGAGRNATLTKNKLKVRLEHIDAPELHYIAPIKGCHDYRQFFGETATRKLHDMLESFGENPLPCRVETRIDNPNDAFDTYGRLIGIIIIEGRGKGPKLHEEINLNLWLAENGWAVPTFYNSASKDEIQLFLKAAKQAMATKAGIWSEQTRQVQEPYLTLLYRKHGSPDPDADVGPLVMPKFFRRQVAWKASAPKFHTYLEVSNADRWVKLDEFLSNPHIKHWNGNLSSLVNDAGMLTAGPADIVFYEKESTLYDAKGKTITDWWPPAAAHVGDGIKKAA